MISLAQALAATLERDGYSAAVINPRFIKPLDREMLERYASRVAAFVTFEDHVKMGGFGTAVVEALDEMGLAVPVVRIGWPDQFIEHGKVDQLRARYGLTVEAAFAQVLPLLAAAAAPRSSPAIAHADIPIPRLGEIAPTFLHHRSLSSCILLTMFRFIRSSRWPRRWPLWIARASSSPLFIWFPRPVDDDTSTISSSATISFITASMA